MTTHRKENEINKQTRNQTENSVKKYEFNSPELKTQGFSLWWQSYLPAVVLKMKVSAPKPFRGVWHLFKRAGGMSQRHRI